MQEVARGQSVAQALKVSLAIVIAQALYRVAIHVGGDVGGIVDRIEIRQERNRDPVVSVDALVTGDDDAHLAGLAAAQFDRGCGANALEIDGVMACGVEDAENAVRLLHQQGRLRMAGRAAEGS